MTMNDVSWACEPAIGAEMIAAVGDVQRGRAGIAAVDVTKRVVDVRALGITGFAARTWLRRHCKINAEFADLRRIVCSLTIGDDAQSADLLVTALSALSSSHTAHPDRKRHV